MWIQGYKLKHNEIPPYYISQEIKRMVRSLAKKHGADFTSSVHSEACYLNFDDVVVSFRNHSGRSTDYEIYLANFNTWRQCEKYFVKRVVPLINRGAVK